MEALKAHIRKEVFMHRPATFNDMLVLAERADQAFQADRNGTLQKRNFPGYSNFNSGVYYNTPNLSRGSYSSNSNRG